MDNPPCFIKKRPFIRARLAQNSTHCTTHALLARITLSVRSAQNCAHWKLTHFLHAPHDTRSCTHLTKHDDGHCQRLLSLTTASTVSVRMAKKASRTKPAVAKTNSLPHIDVPSRANFFSFAERSLFSKSNDCAERLNLQQLLKTENNKDHESMQVNKCQIIIVMA